MGSDRKLAGNKALVKGCHTKTEVPRLEIEQPWIETPRSSTFTILGFGLKLFEKGSKSHSVILFLSCIGPIGSIKRQPLAMALFFMHDNFYDHQN